MASFNIFKGFEKRAVTNHNFSPFSSIDDVIRATEYSSIKAIENSDVFTAIHTIASDVSSLPLKVKDSKHESNDELEYLLNTEPNSVLSGKDLKYILIVNAILNGNAYAEIERDDNGIPINLHYISNDRIENIKKKSNRKHTYELNYEIKPLGNTAKNRLVNSQNMIHIKPFSTDGIIGKSPLIALKDDIETQRNSKKFFNSFFKSGQQAGGIIRVDGDLNTEQKNEIRESWQAANSGENNAHKIIVLDEGTSYEQIKVDTEILKLINESKHNTIQVAKVLGMPLHKMGIETHSTSLEESNSEYVINTLNSYISNIESELNRKLFTDKAVRQSNQITFNTDVYKYADAQTKNENVKAKYELGIISLNEARQELGHSPIDKGDRYIQSLNYMNAELVDKYQLQQSTNVQKNVVDEESLQGGENVE